MPRPCLRRLVALLPAVAVLASTGCFGGPGNPGYFPNLLWPGDIIQTHAKPPGGAYFRDYDPQANRIEVSPNSANNRCQEQQVIVATVYDKDGKPRRGRRVEWIVEGPGNIVEVDESGLVAGRGYKVDNKYAVSYTDYMDHTITRGNSDPRDDFTVAPGQTWCVVTSAVAGETVVTCYAPEVFNWEKGRAYVKLTWGDTDIAFPPRTSGRFGGEVSLSTTIRSIASREGLNPADLRVRYKYAGGVPAELLPPAGVSSARAGTDAIDISADIDGKAPIMVVHRGQKPGRTDIAVEILKPDSSGTGSTVLGRTLTGVDWSAPDLHLEVQAPKGLTLDRDGIVTLVVSNNGQIAGSPVTVNARLPDGFNVGQPDPPADGRNGTRELSWSLPALAAGQKKEIRIPVKPVRNGSFITTAQVTSDDGLKADGRGTTEVGTVGLKLALDQGITAAVGERVPVRLSVTNTGNVPVDGSTAFVTFASGLEHDTGRTQIEVPVGSIPAGQSKSVDVPLIARQAGPQWVRANVSADGGASTDSKETVVKINRSELLLKVVGPETIPPGSDATYEIQLSNRGDVTVPNVNVKAVLPPGLTAKSAEADGKLTGSDAAIWRVGDLPAGTSRTLGITVTGTRAMEKSVISVVALTGTDDRSGQTTRAEAAVAVVGRAALTLEISPPREAVAVGRRAAYLVTVKNRGTAAAKNVALTAEVTSEYANLLGRDTGKLELKPEEGRLLFPEIKSLAAGASASFYVEGEAVKAGDARVKAEVRADYLSQPLRDEQATRIRDKGK